MANKTVATKQSVSAFLNAIEDPNKRKDAKAVAKIMKELSGEKPKMWGSSIVGYGQYHYVYDSGREGDFMRTGFSPRKQNLTLYIMGGFANYDRLLEKLGPHKTGKSCLYVKRLSDVNEKVLRQLISKSLSYMAKKYPENA